jgi:predicted membrane channel-forming protein YqfA (hemolysin III family)
MIGQPIIAFMQGLHGTTMVAILSLIAIVGLVLALTTSHERALFWFVGFLVVAGIVIAVASEGQAWFAGA